MCETGGFNLFIVEEYDFLISYNVKVSFIPDVSKGRTAFILKGGD